MCVVNLQKCMLGFVRANKQSVNYILLIRQNVWGEKGGGRGKKIMCVCVYRTVCTTGIEVLKCCNEFDIVV